MNIQFEMKCRFKKGVYQRNSKEILNLTSTFTSDRRLFIPSFVNYDKEFMVKMTYSTKVDGYAETITDIEESHKFVEVP